MPCKSFPMRKPRQRALLISPCIQKEKMAVTSRLLYTVIIFYNVHSSWIGRTEGTDGLKPSTVYIAVLVRNKEITLPYFLTYLSRLDYPKERIALGFSSDHNSDRSIEIIERWLSQWEHLYHYVQKGFDSRAFRYKDEEGPAHWPPSRYEHIIKLREGHLQTARRKWADFIWMLDADVFLTNPDILNSLIRKNSTVTAPVLRSGGLYSNFWCGMTSEYYYQRTSDYGPILNRKKKGCFQVPMVHSSVLIDLRVPASDLLTYDPKILPDYEGPLDDIITFALSANKSGVSMEVCNDAIYGYVMVPLDKDESLSYDLYQLRNLKMEVLVDGEPLTVDPELESYIQRASSPPLAVDKTFMINLKRRPDRRTRMMNSFDELQLDVTIVDAVDGQLLTDYELERLGVRLMPGYKDPFHKRPMKRGEIGCFLSHYKIWSEVISQKYDIVLVLEDDVRFEPFFNQKMETLLKEVKGLSFDWDLIYLGRKKLQEKNEELVDGTTHLVWADYSYWTLGYLLSRSGARKLIAQEPLKNLLPVDEYLPILYDKQPAEEWKEFYPIRDLVALSAEPLFLYPTRYLHEEGYVSDTEDSPLISTPNPEL